DGRVRVDRHELEGEPGVRLELLEVLADPLLLDLAPPLQHLVERPEPLEESARRLVPDCRHSRDVVRRVSHEREEVADPLRLDAELRLDLARPEDLDLPSR